MTGSKELIMMKPPSVKPRLRDAEEADHVGRLADLGYFDIEFTMYGCAYLEKGKLFYKVSSSSEDIYRFIENAHLKEIYPSNIASFTQKYAVPAGMEHLLEYDVKKSLGRQLKNLYPKELFEILAQSAQEVKDCALAIDYLWEKAKELEGHFNEKRLHEFEIELNYMLQINKICMDSCRQLNNWLIKERKNMEEAFLEKDLFMKTIYGICYIEDDRLVYKDNAQYSSICEIRENVIQAGKTVSPIYSQTYGYNYRYRLRDVMTDFCKSLKTVYNEAFMQKISAIADCESGIDTDKFMRNKAILGKKYGKAVSNTLERYRKVWHIE